MNLAVLNLAVDNSDVTGKVKETTSLFERLSEKVSAIFIARSGAADTGTAIVGMQQALLAANNAATPVASTLNSVEAGLQGAAAIARTTSTAIALLPKVFSGLPPAVNKSLSSISLAARTLSVFRGQLSPLGAAMAYVEMRNLGMRRSYAALITTLGVATSSVINAGRKITSSVGGIGRTVARGGRGISTLAGTLAIGAMGLAGPLVGMAGAAGLAGVGLAGLKKSFDLGGELNDLSARTGIAVKDLTVLRQAFVNNGKSAEDVGPVVNKLQKALSGVNEDGDPTNKTFEQLGLNMEALRDLSPAEQFKSIGAEISKIENPAQRAAMAMGIFGKSGGELLTFFADKNAFGDAAKQVGSQAEILDRNAGLFDKVSDTLGTIGTKVQGFFVGAADKLAPIIEPVMDWFAGLDLAAIGQRVGAGIAGFVGVITNGSLWDAVGNFLAYEFGRGVNVLYGGTLGAARVAGQLFPEAVKTAVMWFDVLTKPDFWTGLGQTLVGIAQNFGATLLEKVADLIEVLKGIPVVGEKIGAGAERIRSTAADMRSVGDRNTVTGADKLAPFEEEISTRYREAFSSLAATFNQGMKDGEIFPTDAIAKNFANAADRIMATFNQANAQRTESGKEKSSPFDLSLAKGEKDSKSDRPKAPRLMAIAGFGLFVKDPLMQESRRQTEEAKQHTKHLKQIVKNTARKSDRTPNKPQRFT